MSLRARIAAVASLCVALAVMAAAVGVYFAVRSDLRGGIDTFLRGRAQTIVTLVSAVSPHVPLPARPRAGVLGRVPFSANLDGIPLRLPRPAFGDAAGYFQFVARDGRSQVAGRGAPATPLTLTARERQVAASGRGRSLEDRNAGGTDLRVLAVGLGARGAVLIARPLTEVNRELENLLVPLALLVLGAMVLAAVPGALVARAALSPIVDFTRRTEELAGSPDLSGRLEIGGKDELGRLAQSFNSLLDTVERSVQAQRHLIADASHELRTPIASLKANIQVLNEAERLSGEDRLELHRDIEEELDQLTSLVADVVELARGAGQEGAAGELRLDGIVHEAVQRARRRNDLRFEEHLEPTVIVADGRRVDRAVSNLLENACKWSALGGGVEVDLRGGLLTVRDHGPGFQPNDLPHVFDRFYRAEQARGLPGSGLGLAIVRQVAESSGGQASAHNAPGGGALLRVSFGPPVQAVSSGGPPPNDA
ncbi:MAG: HAMP domain-containing sensor histidine kinase [Solirubrobacteraceae bacterium]